MAAVFVDGNGRHKGGRVLVWGGVLRGRVVVGSIVQQVIAGGKKEEGREKAGKEKARCPEKRLSVVFGVHGSILLISLSGTGGLKTGVFRPPAVSGS
jgi:hypothetical protein